MVTRIILPLGVMALVFGLGGGLLAGCSVLIDVDKKQCATTEDCVALGPAFEDATCEQSVCVLPSGGADLLVCDAPDKSSKEKVKYSFAPIYVAGSEPAEPEPFTIRACNPADLECVNPVDGPHEVNAGEPHDFLVPPGFQGYFYITNKDSLDALVFMGRPILQDTVGWNVTIPTPVLVRLLSDAAGDDVDPDLGLIIAVARDCNVRPIEGVKFTNSKEGLQFYFLNSFPDTSLDATTAQGAVGFANVPISITTLRATLPSGQVMKEGIIRVKPKTASLVELFP